MDLLAEIKHKARTLAEHSCFAGVNAIIRHIERAERHLTSARLSKDDELFNDVVYRTNQAFEGALKEAFLVLADVSATDLSTHQVEQKLLEKTVLVPRVADLLTNYRRQWRNPSTHDHTLLVRDQEAFLAIVSVSAFVSVLVDQMVEVISRRRQHEAAERRLLQIRDALGNYDDLTFDDQVIRLLQVFCDKWVEDLPRAMATEFQLLGRLTGFINSADPTIEIEREPAIRVSDGPRPDLLLAKNGECIVVEMHGELTSHSDLTNARFRMLNYLHDGGWHAGVVFVPPRRDNQVVQVDITGWPRIGNKHKVFAVYALSEPQIRLGAAFSADVD